MNSSQFWLSRLRSLLASSIILFMSYQTKLEVTNWLEDHQVKNFTINTDLSVDVEGNVDISECNLSTIAIQFSYIGGNFDCKDNALTSLKGAPRIVKGIFNCNQNQLESLIDGPQIVGADYFCEFNNLKNLKGSPQMITGKFNCSSNYLVSLEGGPQLVNDYFVCSYNQLETLEHCPKRVGAWLGAYHNKLTTLDFLPFSIGENKINLLHNKTLGALANLTSFEDARKESLRIKAVKSYAKELSEALQVKPVSVKVKI